MLSETVHYSTGNEAAVTVRVSSGNRGARIGYQSEGAAGSGWREKTSESQLRILLWSRATPPNKAELTEAGVLGSGGLVIVKQGAFAIDRLQHAVAVCVTPDDFAVIDEIIDRVDGIPVYLRVEVKANDTLTIKKGTLVSRASFDVFCNPVVPAATYFFGRLQCTSDEGSTCEDPVAGGSAWLLGTHDEVQIASLSCHRSPQEVVHGNDVNMFAISPEGMAEVIRIVTEVPADIPNHSDVVTYAYIKYYGT
jgi:hypothetical protein